MGCDIHSYVESQSESGKWEHVAWTHGEYPDDGPFGWRSYGLFGWLADVRNYSAVPPVTEPRGLPDDLSTDVSAEAHCMWDGDGHGHSWLSVDELIGFDYDQTFEDRRVTRGNHGGVTADPGEGQMVTYREFFGPAFFTDLEELRKLNDQRTTRLVFWFDN